MLSRMAMWYLLMTAGALLALGVFGEFVDAMRSGPFWFSVVGAALALFGAFQLGREAAGVFLKRKG